LLFLLFDSLFARSRFHDRWRIWRVDALTTRKILTDSYRWFFQILIVQILSDGFYRWFLQMILADGSYRFLWMILTVAFTDDSYRWFLQGIILTDSYRFLQILTFSYRWVLQVILTYDPDWWFLQMILTDDSYRWFLQMILTDSYRWFLQILADFQVEVDRSPSGLGSIMDSSRCSLMWASSKTLLLWNFSTFPGILR